MPFGASRLKTTVVSSGASMFPAESTPPSADCAFAEPPSGLMSFSKVATTSSEVIGAPLWNVTPERIVNVQTDPSSFGSQLSARRGWSSRFSSEKDRYSPVEPSMPAPPSSWTRSGFGSVVG